MKRRHLRCRAAAARHAGPPPLHDVIKNTQRTVLCTLGGVAALCGTPLPLTRRVALQITCHSAHPPTHPNTNTSHLFYPPRAAVGNGYTLGEMVALSGIHTIGFESDLAFSPPELIPMTRTPAKWDLGE